MASPSPTASIRSLSTIRASTVSRSVSPLARSSPSDRENAVEISVVLAEDEGVSRCTRRSPPPRCRCWSPTRPRRRCADAVDLAVVVAQQDVSRTRAGARSPTTARRRRRRRGRTRRRRPARSGHRRRARDVAIGRPALLPVGRVDHGEGAGVAVERASEQEAARPGPRGCRRRRRTPTTLLARAGVEGRDLGRASPEEPTSSRATKTESSSATTSQCRRRSRGYSDHCSSGSDVGPGEVRGRPKSSTRALLSSEPPRRRGTMSERRRRPRPPGPPGRRRRGGCASRPRHRRGRPGPPGPAAAAVPPAATPARRAAHRVAGPVAGRRGALPGTTGAGPVRRRPGGGPAGLPGGPRRGRGRTRGRGLRAGERRPAGEPRVVERGAEVRPGPEPPPGPAGRRSAPSR